MKTPCRSSFHHFDVARGGARRSTSRASASAAARTSWNVQRGSMRTLMWIPRDRQVIAGEIELGVAALRKEDLVGVGERHLAPFDLEHFFSRRHAPMISADSALAENLAQFHRRRLLQLIVPALGRRLVRPPALEGGRVPEPIALQMIVGDLADALDAQRLPGEILAAIPA